MLDQVEDAEVEEKEEGEGETYDPDADSDTREFGLPRYPAQSVDLADTVVYHGYPLEGNFGLKYTSYCCLNILS